MAQRKKDTAHQPKKQKKRAEDEQEEKEEKSAKHYSWDDDSGSVQQGLLVISLFALAAISFLSFINAAGEFGVWVDRIFGWIFGWGRYMMPIVFAILGYVFLHPDKYEIRIVNYIGLVIFLLSSLALLHLFLPLNAISDAAGQGRGGGYLGVVLAFPLLRFAGVWVTIIVLIGLFLASWLIMFNTSLMHLFGRIRLLGVLARPFVWVKSRVHARMNGYRLDTTDETPDEEYIEEEGVVDVEEEDPEDESAAQGFASKEVMTEDEQQLIDMQAAAEAEQMELIPKAPRRPRKKIEIPLNLLSHRESKPTSGDIEANKQKIQDTLGSFGIEVEMGAVSVGPMVTQYTLKPSTGVKLTQITTLQNDIALALAAHPIRIEAPIPGQALVGIEVPNTTAATVALRELIGARKFKQQKGALNIALGKDVSGTPYYTSLAGMPHILIAGATGSGKSVCINGVIISLLYQYSPDQLRFIMVDPKRVELTVYNDIPHLLTPVITDVEKTINSLKWTVAEMDRRYDLLSRAGKRNIDSYNMSVPEDEELPYIVLIIDELADLMATAAASVEAAIVRLAQMSRAVGIHLVLATQRPSVNVITGLIKANMPARIAFSVASLVDSRTILDFSGAEKLLGRGDMLYIDAKLSKPKRLQGAFVDDEEIEHVVDFLRKQADPEYNSDITEHVSASGPGISIGGDSGGEDSDELVGQAKEVILQAGKASASLLQRRLRVGYARAARILDILEEQGFIGPADGAKPREILASADTDADFDGDMVSQAPGFTDASQEDTLVDDETQEEDYESDEDDDTDTDQEEKQSV